MTSLLAASRIPVSLLPERLIGDSARDEGIEQVAPSWTRLNFTMQQQEQTEWCWAATSVSVSDYYDPHAGWRQCGVVNAEKGLDICCRDGSNEACDQPNVLDSPLSRAGVFDHKQSGPAAYDAIRHEIDAGRPVAWHVHWSGGGGHFAVIEGYQRDGDEWVAVEDPWYGPSDVTVSTLTEGTYQGRGS